MISNMMKITLMTLDFCYEMEMNLKEQYPKSKFKYKWGLEFYDITMIKKTVRRLKNKNGK